MVVADYTSLFLSNVIKPTFSFTFHQIKDNTYFWEKFLMKTAASFSLHLNCISHPFSDGGCGIYTNERIFPSFSSRIFFVSTSPTLIPYPCPLTPLVYPSRHRLPGTLYFSCSFFLHYKRIHVILYFSRLSSFHSPSYASQNTSS